MKTRIILITALLLAALVIPVLAGQGPQIRVTHSASRADQPDVAIDSNGYVHIAYSDNYNTNKREIWYTMLDDDGNTLIDDTRLTVNDDHESTRPAIVVGSDDSVHILWRDQRWDGGLVQEITYTKLDPYLDDMDGTAAVSSTITLVDDARLTDLGDWAIYGIRVALDSNDDLHVVWDNDDADTIQYMKLDSDGNELIAETVLRYAQQWRALPDVAVDSNDNLHITWADYENTSSDEVYYMMLDGSDGSTLIDATRITVDDDNFSKWTTIVVDDDDKVHLVWQDQRAAASSGTHEIYYARLDPSLDDQDGSAADLASIVLVSDTPLTPDDGHKSRHPAVATDGHFIHVTWEEDDYDNIHYLVVDAHGHVVVPDTALSTTGMAYPSTKWAVPYLDVETDGTAHVVWCDSRDGDYEVYYTYYAHPLVKAVDDAAPLPNQRITYTISIANTITTTTLTDAIVSDTLPTGLSFAGPVTLDPPQPGVTLADDAGDLPVLAAGLTLTASERVTITFPVTVTPGTQGQTLVNTAALTSTQVPTPDSWSAVVAVPIADLHLTKSAAPLAVPGQAFTYSIVFGNADDALLATNVVISDLLPVGRIDNPTYDSSGAVITATPGVTFSWQVEDLAPGAGGVITITGIVNPGLASPSFISNTAVITSSDPDGNPVDNYNQAGAIVLLPDARPTLVANTGLTLPLDAVVTIATANLHTTDAENGPDALTYTLEITPLHGDVLLDGAPLGVGDAFTQTAIDQNRLEYDHDGSPTLDDRFHFSVNDSSTVPITRVSVDSGGGEGNERSYKPSISADGRYVAFESDADNLVINDTNGVRDIFVHDRQTGQTIRVSLDSGGTQGNDNSYDAAISADGRYVAFESEADNLVTGDTNNDRDIFVHDVQTGQTTRVSVSSAGYQSDRDSYDPAISADGRYVAFVCRSDVLVGGGYSPFDQVFVHDRQTGQTTRVSVDAYGLPGNFHSQFPGISADGRYVAFESEAYNLVDGDTNDDSDIFVHDRQTGQTTRVSVDSDGGQVDGWSETPAISADGRYVAFVSYADSLVAGDSNGIEDAFVHDRLTGQTTRVSVDSDGEQAWSGEFQLPVLSADGRYVAFESYSADLTADDTNAVPDVVVHDRLTGQTTRISVNSAGMQGNNASYAPAISADGRYVAFRSNATNMVAGDGNNFHDVFVRDNGAVLDVFELRMLIPDVGLSKSVDPILVQPGDPITYTISFANIGSALATNVVVSDAVPVGRIDNPTYSSSGAVITPTGSISYTWNVEDLAPGAGGVITINGVVAPGLGPLDFISNTATITTTGVPENAPFNNSSAAEAFVYVPAGWPTLSANTGLTLPVGATEPFTTTHLQVTDAENGPDAITYTLQITPLHGELLFNGSVTLLPGDTFAQDDLDQQRLEYHHDGSLSKDDEFLFTANDSATGRTIRVSINSTGTQSVGGDSSAAAISADGRYVAFVSNASNLVGGDTNGQPDVFIHDRLTGQTTRVSVDSGGNQSSGGTSSAPAISADGRYVAFVSTAVNLVGGDTNAQADVFVHDRLTQQTTRVSVDSAGNQAMNGGSYAPALSASGRYVAFYSYAGNLVADDTNVVYDVFVHDRQTGETTRVSVDSDGNQGNGNALDPDISADGRYVIFESPASNLIPDDTNGVYDIFVHDRVTGQTTRVSVASDGSQGNNGGSTDPTISADGRYAAFRSTSTNLVGGDTNTHPDIFVHDRLTGQTTRVSVDSDGTQSDGMSYTPDLSAHGRYVAFDSYATNLIPNDTNGRRDIFVHDQMTGQTTRVSVDSADAQATGSDSNTAAISADGRYVAFDSLVTNLVVSDTNSLRDVFVHDRGTVLDTFALRMLVPDVALHKRVHFPYVDVGDAITYTILFGNTGYADATDVRIVDIEPAVVGNWAYTYTGAAITLTGMIAWDVQDLAPGEGGVITVTGVVNPGLASNTHITNSAVITTVGHVEYNQANDRSAVRALVLRLNDAPILAANTGRIVVAGTTLPINTNHLQVTDEESGPALLTYTLQTTPTHGDLLRAGVPLLTGDTFTQAAINGGLLAYAHDGSPGASDSFAFTASDTAASPTTRVSVDSAGGQGNNLSDEASISADGRYVAFESAANTLVVSDTNYSYDIFVHDRLAGETTRVSVDSAGNEGNGHSYEPAISADGRYVAFRSYANTLVVSDTNSSYDIFVHDRQTGQTTRVSVDSAGGEGNDDSFTPVLSADGRYVAFRSYADNLVGDDTNGREDIFVHDRLTGQTTCVSVNSAGVQGEDDSFDPVISANGRYVAFESDARNLVSDDTNYSLDVFVQDRLTGETTCVSVDSAGIRGDGDSYNPAISADGRYVTFESNATNLVGGDTNNTKDIFVHDRQTGQTTRLSVDSTGSEGNDDSYNPAISADGQYVTFESNATNMVGDDTNSRDDVFVHDRQTGQTARLSVDSVGGEGNSDSYNPAISASGRYVAFGSDANNLVGGDTNATRDVFVRDTGFVQDVFDLVIVDQPDVRLVKTVVPTQALPGQPVTYTLAFSNAGSFLALNVFISDTVPGDQAGDWSYTSSGASVTFIGQVSNTWTAEVENLSPGESGVITMTGVVTWPLASGLTFTNTAAITCTLDGIADNNRSNAAVTVRNAPPVAGDDAGTTPEETPLVLDVLANDYDLNGDSLTLAGVGDGLSGTTAISGSMVIYTPTFDFYGSDSFTYTVEDGDDLSDVGLVNVTVTNTNDAPVAVDDGYDVIYETPLVVPVADGVLDNDVDVDGDPLTATLIISPAGGLVLNPNGSFIFTPTTGFTGTDTFSYYAYDSSLVSSNVATVTLNVTGGVIEYPVYLPFVLRNSQARL